MCDRDLTQGCLTDLIVEIALFLFVEDRIFVLEQVGAEELVLISGLLLRECYVVEFAI